jgi:WD40 repeat protein
MTGKFDHWIFSLLLVGLCTAVLTSSISSAVAAGTMLQKLVDDDVVNSAVFSPDGSKLATASDDNTTRIWDVATGKMLQKLVHDDSVYSVAFRPDGSKLATASEDNTTRIWDVAT